MTAEAEDGHAVEPAFDRDFDAAPGQLVRLTPLVRRMVAPNPGPMTFRGTNTYVVGEGAVAVIDPGPDLPSHGEALLAALGDERVAAILVTHTHRDHSPLARALAVQTGAPILGCRPFVPSRPPRSDAEAAAMAAANDIDYAPTGVLEDGDAFEGEGFTLQAVATPGHTANHLAFVLTQERALFSGDHVMAWSTTVVAPPTGAMGPFMASLDRLRVRDDAIYWPGHGGPVRQPQRFVRALLHHRRQREHAILARLAKAPSTVEAIVAAIYDALDPRLHGAAALSVLAHLEDLGERRITATDGGGAQALYRLA